MELWQCGIVVDTHSPFPSSRGGGEEDIPPSARPRTLRPPLGFAAEAMIRRHGMKVSFDITLSRARECFLAETFAVRRLIASTFGLRQAQDTNADFVRHEYAPSGLHEYGQPWSNYRAVNVHPSATEHGMVAELFTKSQNSCKFVSGVARFVSRGLPRTEGWNGAAAFDEGRA